jgi:hypothetical protein
MACQTDFSTVITADGNITCKRADTFHLETQFLYADDDTPYDISSFDTLTAHVKDSAKDPTYLLSFTIGDGFTVNGSILIWDKVAGDMDLEAKAYVYDIEGDESGIITTIGGGSFTLVSDVTREGDTP